MEQVSLPEWDVVVVGAGLAGSFAAYQLARHPLRILVIELGTGAGSMAPGLLRILRGGKTGGRWAGSLHLHSAAGGPPRRIEAYLGQGPGGSSAIYNAALGRFRRSDFLEDRAEPEPGGEPALPNAWPVDCDAFDGYYARAEALMRIVGERDPLDPDDASAPGAPPPLARRDAAIRDDLRRNGLHPYRLRVGMDYLPGCGECQGRRCPRGCKAEGASRALAPALATGRVAIRPGLRVRAIERGGNGVLRVLAEPAGSPAGRPGGSPWGSPWGSGVEIFAAHRVVLAAGALNTPLILARSARLWESAPAPAMLGRGLMFHLSDVFAVRAPGTRGKEIEPGRPRKTLAFRDFYAKLGEVQSTGFDLGPGLAMAAMRARLDLWGLGLPRRAAEVLRPLAWGLARLMGPIPTMATIVQDLPHPGNRVWEEAGPDGRPSIALAYSASPGLARRVLAMRRRLRRAFAPNRLLFLSAPGTPNWGHPMGTARMGTDPATSVTDPEGRLRGHPDIVVADASLFPSSGGTGPSLTVAANAMRVADALAADLRPAVPELVADLPE